MTPQQFRERRQELGYTQEQLAQELGVTVRAVAKWEAGNAPIDRRTQLAMRYLALLRSA